MSHYMPAPSRIFVGRDEQLQRIEQAISKIAVVVICGAPGIGKSALAFAVAENWGRRAIYHRIAEGEPLGRLLDDVRRAISRGPVPEIAEDDERVSDLAERLDAAQGLLVVDDLYRLDRDDRLRLVLGIGQLLHLGRLVVLTRDRPELGTAVDRLEIPLAGLDEASARTLWAALDDLYQPSPGFELAWRRSQGNPLILRQIHRSRPAVDPRDAAIADSIAVVLDGRKHELRIDGRIHALRRQTMLREILYALSARQGHVVSKREVARRLWHGQYDPAVHDNRLWANIHRLRRFLAPSGLNIEFIGDGYRLAPASDFVFVDPLT